MGCSGSSPTASPVKKSKLDGTAKAESSQFSIPEDGNRVHILRKNLEASEASHGTNHPDTLQAKADLAKTLRLLGRDSEALPLQQQRLQALRAELGDSHQDTLQAMG